MELREESLSLKESFGIFTNEFARIICGLIERFWSLRLKIRPQILLSTRHSHLFNNSKGIIICLTYFLAFGRVCFPIIYFRRAPMEPLQNRIL